MEVLTSQRQAGRTGFILRLMLGLQLVVVGLAFLDEANDPAITAAVHGPAIVVELVGLLLHRRGRAREAAWIASFVFWLVVAGSTWFFGGLRFEMGSAYVVSIMIAAATLGSRVALMFGAMSVGAATVVTVADLTGRLPPSIAPESPVNGWISVTMSIGIAAVLLHVVMRDLQRAVSKAASATSERDAAKIRLLQAERMEPVGRLAGGVAHDFNNLLTVMNSVAALLRAEDSDAELLDELEGAIARATQMTGQLLAFSRDRRGKPILVDLAATVRGLAPILSRLVGDAIEVRVEADGGTLMVRAAPGQLEQVVLNLVVNARDAMPDGGALRILCQEAKREEIMLVVEDEGLGMDEATQREAFSAFFTTKPSGTGLGLATVADIVEGCGGRIQVESASGRGTRVEIRLPRAAVSDDDAPGEDAPPSATTPSGRSRVLLVDDHALVRRTTRQLLEQAGFEVTAVRDGVEALSLVEAGLGTAAAFDLVVSDVMMPRMGGPELVGRLQRLDFDAPLLLVSGNVDRLPEELEESRFPLGFLAKPFTKDDLLVAIGGLMRRGACRADDAS